MQIIIPMSGIGKRFIDAGYKDPKPLIKVDGMPIIEHVINMFPGEENFTFICNKEHLETTEMRNILKRIAPKGSIIEIPPHKKGPVFAVDYISDRINDDDEVIVNYCDFSCYWNYQDFLEHTRKRNADGAIPAYKGYHPHMLGTTNYAFMRDKEQWMLEIKEKEPFTDNRMNEYASSGTYYFKKGSYVKKYFKELMDKDINLNGEFYVSLVYNFLRNDNLNVSIYEIQHMLQWGTPQDLREYESWSSYFKQAIEVKKEWAPEQNSTILIPLAGAGSRFVKGNYKDPKPLIPVSGKAMIIQATEGLPAAENHVFVCLKEHLGKYPLAEELKREYSDAKIVSIDQITEGQACTCELGLQDIDLEAPLLIGACDNGMVWDADKYAALINDTEVDAIVFSFRHHVSSQTNPQMYGWIKKDENDFAEKVSVKVPISDDPFNDHAIVGTFYFKKAKYFLAAVKNLYEKNIRVNGEFYVDSCLNEVIANGQKVKVFELEHYVCWGTPNDLRTFEYWQSFFNKWPWHPYSIKNDRNVNKAKTQSLVNKAFDFKQSHE
ncbi:NDP-sugar pyrophosphorylase, includes eIF-2Bgamma, eIF-2Bepsilon, and LPS biosynthesis proteins [Paenibacillus tianmuensis]|uniref:NDP-sugar pyrophosphorylase, includes eIF-2Bgamma, eIF-2Bepsilon, and LPS biosynthesis proteins n=1 Tax=Paenibacillus tianmuensis TaxID=624147 RepID=A0A1G4TVU1_9BACL|nr:sugar phosphate nucleotidyltransferase [Paenibacillus tianmuensis]SCW85532.1 NDP-sugar pyrophosphorylase, includes eIF-2Bgamma, eIF-2Bepsilon, and LPS biosynthesis proteins [Paenibacillus tianmuensis]